MIVSNLSGVTESTIGRCVNAEKGPFTQNVTRKSANRKPYIPSEFFNKL